MKILFLVLLSQKLKSLKLKQYTIIQQIFQIIVKKTKCFPYFPFDKN